MEYSIKEKQIEAVLTSVNLESTIEGGRVDVLIGDAAKMEVAEALNYIKSGQAEVQETVDEGIADFNQNASEKTAEFNSNASSKTADFNTNATSKTGDFNTNAGAKTTAFNENATAKTNTFNQNATDKTTAFNNNASEKTTAFNENYTEKKALIDEHVGIAQTAAETATTQAGIATDKAEEASDSATSAETYARQAESSASEASTSATNAYQSEVNAGQSASDASDSATSASNSATTATTQAGIATTKASEASTSATNASNSASSASSSASTATTQAGIATTKASEASTSASNASLSEQNASSYADSASQSALDAATSETNASQSASNASQSATTATAQASIATSKATEASSSATSASNSASSASSSATTATNQANLAKQYAIGDPTEPTEHSAKYWAEQAESELSGLSSRVTTIEGNYVTTDTAQDISAKKTFLGEKAILFKQTATTDKLGFTLYNTGGSELGAFEWRPNTISGGALLNVNVPYSSSNYVGFRYWGTAVNIIAPKVSSAGNYYIPVHFTDGTNTVTASSNGTVNLSSILPNSAVWGNITGTLSNQTDLQTALDGKQDTISDLSTIRSGAELGATSIQPNDNVSELTNDAGYITGITSSDVTTALGYTPYNSTNPAGYTSNVGTVTSVNNTQPDANGNVTISTGGNYTAGTGISISSNTISVASPTLTNAATGSGNLVVGGSQPVSTANTSFGFYSSTSLEGTSFGYGATASGSEGVAIGYGANATASHSTALGTKSTSSGMFAIQIGRGTNSTDYSLSIGFDSTGNYQLLDGTTGLIPDARISSNIARTSSIPTVDQTYDGTSSNAQSGTAVAQALSSVSVSKDNLSITNNANNQLQTVGVIDQNDTTQAIKTWTGTLAQYNAISTKDPDTLYNITDDTAGGSSVYTKSEVDNLLSNIGFPTGQYIDLSSQIPLVANTAYSYTAPADGWFFFNARATSNNCYLGCFGDSLYRHIEVWGNQEWVLCPPVLPMRKGQTISDIRSNFTPTDFTVRFIYAKEN